MRPSIVYIQYTNPAAYPSLEHSAEMFAAAGWSILFLGTASEGSAELRFSRQPTARTRQLRYCPPGWRQKAHYLWFCVWCLYWIFRHPPQWIYASDSLSCPIALLLSVIPWVKVVYHEHDSPADEPRSFFWSVVLFARRRLAQRADLCVLPNAERMDQFVRMTGRRGNPTLCVWNCPTIDEVSDITREPPTQEFVVTYHGSIVPARLPKTVVEALALLPNNVKLQVMGYETVGHKGYVGQLTDLARKSAVLGRIEFVGPLATRRELLDRCSRAHVGLALMPLKTSDVNECLMTGASNKPFDYMACGLPVLVSSRTDWVKMFVEPGYGVDCDPTRPDSLAAAIRKLIEDPEKTKEMGLRARAQVLREWNYEKQFKPVLQRMMTDDVYIATPGTQEG